MQFFQIKQLQAQVREAENRADQMDQDKERMEFVLEQVCIFFHFKIELLWSLIVHLNVIPLLCYFP